MRKEVNAELWPAPWFIRWVLIVLCLASVMSIGSLVLHNMYLYAVTVLVLSVVAFCYIYTPFRRFGSKYFDTEAVHFDNNLVELEIGGAEYWKSDPTIRDYAGSLNLAEFRGFFVRDINVKVGEMVQRMAICVKINFYGFNPERTLNLFRAIRFIDPTASIDWRGWLRERFSLKVADVVTSLAIKGNLSSFIHENMDNELNELLRDAMKPELDLISQEFTVFASYQLLASNEDVDEFFLSEKADQIKLPPRHIYGTLPCVPRD